MPPSLELSIVLAVAAAAAVMLYARARHQGSSEVGGGYPDPWYCILFGLIAVSAAFAAVVSFAAWAWSLFVT